MRRSIVVGVVTVAAAVGVGLSIGGGGGGGSGLANIWVDTNGGTCVDNASLTAYNDAQACGTFDAANDTAEAGDLILVKDGNYTNQTITGSNSRSAMATIEAENTDTDSRVTFDILTTNGDWLTIKHMDSHTGETTHMGSAGGCNWCSKEGGSNLLLDDVNLWGKWSAGEISGGSVHAIADNVTHQNSEIGQPNNPSSGYRVCGQDDNPFRVSEATDVFFIRNIYHPQFGEAPCGGDAFHLETFRLWDTIDGITFLHNRFPGPRGDNTGIISSDRGGCPPETCPNNINHKVIGNVFGDKPGFAGFDFSTGEDCQGVVVAYNTFYGPNAGFQNGCDTQGTGMVYVGNIAYNSGGCVMGGTSPVNSPNLWYANSHGTCAGNTWLTGAEDNLSAYQFASDGYHLTSSSPAINAGENTLCQQYTGGFDIDGEPRDDGTCDAGADEYHAP